MNPASGSRGLPWRKILAVLLVPLLYAGMLESRGSGTEANVVAATSAPVAAATAQAAVSPTTNVPPTVRKQRPKADWDAVLPLPDKAFSGFAPVRVNGVRTEVSATAMRNASLIVRIGKQDLQLPRRAWVIAIATTLVECGMLNCANPKANCPYMNEGSATDYDSCGLFQQRPSKGWGTPHQVMNKEYATKKFYSKLMGIKGWENMSVSDAAQSVQISGFPDKYGKFEAAANAIIDYVLQYEPV